MEICIGNFLVSVNLGFYIRSVQIIAPRPRPASRQQSSSSILNQMQLNDQGLIPTLNRILSAAVAAELAQDQEADESCLPVTGREMGLLETVFLSIITSHFGIGDRRKS